ETITQEGLSQSNALKWLEVVADTWTKREEGKPLVELEPLKELVAAIAAGSDSGPAASTAKITATTTATAAVSGGGSASALTGAKPKTDVFTVIDAFDVPTWWYDPGKKMFTQPFEKGDIMAPAEAKSALFRQRYDLLRQRVMRNENFMPVSFSDQEKDRFFKLSNIDSLQGREGEHFLLFGMLSQLEEGKLFLEDKAGSIELDFSEMSEKHSSVNGLFTESCFALVDGYLEDGIFKVEEIGLPPPEKKEVTRAAFPNVNFFGGNPSLRTDSQLRAIEVSNENGIIILSDTWLDKQETMEALQRLFEGFSHTSPPIAFIFIGDFCSKPFVPGSGETTQYRDNMTALGQLIASFPEIARKSHFVFVPGNNDPWGQGALPKPPLAEFFTKRLGSRVSNVTFTTNPCRIKYCTHEIVIFREDMLKRMRRNSVLPPIEGTEVVKHLVRTVIDQGHLCPLPQRIRPIYWAYDHAMRVYPIPDVLVLADRFDAYSINYEGCHCINPGSFSSGDLSFFMYFPVTRTSQYSKVPRK
ncbi:DNA-directed DNA polymerase epsilon, subunit B, partial [Coemansia sp. Benny D115]